MVLWQEIRHQLCCPDGLRESWIHAEDCYFCLINTTGFNASSKKRKNKISQPSLSYETCSPLRWSSCPYTPSTKILFLHQMKNCLLETISLFIQEEMVMNPTGSPRKTWMIMFVICKQSQSSWYPSLSSRTRSQEFPTQNNDFTSWKTCATAQMSLAYLLTLAQWE